MRLHRLSASAAAFAVFGATFTVFGQATAAHAATSSVVESTTTLSLTSYADMAVNDVRGHVFISGGSSSGFIEVTDLGGNLVTTITAAAGATGLALSSDGGTLYAALTTQGEIAAINTTSLQVTATYPTGSGSQPAWLALSGGELWFTSGAASTIGELNLGTGTVSSTTASGFTPESRLFASPAAPNVLVSASATESSTVNVYNVSTGAPVSVTSMLSASFCQGAAESAAFTSDGADLLFACDYPYAVTEVKLSDLSTVRTYPTDPYPDSVAVSSTGQIAAGVFYGTGTSAIKVFNPGDTTPVATYSESDFSTVAVAWNSSGGLYGVTEALSSSASSPNVYKMHVLRRSSSMSVSGPASAATGNTIHFTGTVSSAGAVAGGVVLVTRTDAKHPSPVGVGLTPVGPDGSFSFDPNAAEFYTDTFTFTFTFPGSGGAGASSSSAAVWVYPAVLPWRSGHGTPTATGSSNPASGAVPSGTSSIASHDANAAKSTAMAASGGSPSTDSSQPTSGFSFMHSGVGRCIAIES
jgi:hypothetical protein